MLLLVLEPQAMESDKNYLQTKVTRSAFPLEEPSHWKGSHQHVPAPFFRACPEAGARWLQVREEETEARGTWPSTGLRSQGRMLLFRCIFFFLLNKIT